LDDFGRSRATRVGCATSYFTGNKGKRITFKASPFYPWPCAQRPVVWTVRRRKRRGWRTRESSGEAPE
jgi:hypothetical protein